MGCSVALCRAGKYKTLGRILSSFGKIRSIHSRWAISWRWKRIRPSSQKGEVGKVRLNSGKKGGEGRGKLKKGPKVLLMPATQTRAWVKFVIFPQLGMCEGRRKILRSFKLSFVKIRQLAQIVLFLFHQLLVVKETYSFSHLPKYERRKSSIRAPFQGRGGSFFLSLVFRPAVWLSSSSVVYLRATSRRDRIDIVHNSRRAPMQGRTKGPLLRDYFSLGEAVGKPLLASPKMRKINMAWTATLRIWKYRAPCYTAKLPRALNKTKSCIYPTDRSRKLNAIRLFPAIRFFSAKKLSTQPTFFFGFHWTLPCNFDIGVYCRCDQKGCLVNYRLRETKNQHCGICFCTFNYHTVRMYILSICILYII